MTWVELRVHGVSGAPPESLLGVPHVEQVAGDEFSRFFRPVGGGAGHVLEGYHWGRFTSGTWRQSLALLLVPFGLVNAAQFMLERPETWFEKVMHLIAGAALRLLALVLTALIAFTLGLILIDIVAWRWAPSSELFDGVPLAWLVAGAAAAAALGVVALALLGFSPGTRLPPDPVPQPTPPSTALDPAFFAADPNALTMRALHVATGFGVIALLLALVREGDAWAAPVVVLALVALVVAASGDPERSVTVGFAAPRRGGRALIAATVLLLATALIVLVAEGVQTHRELADGAPPAALTDFDHVANGLMVAAVLVLGVLHAANVFLGWRGPGAGAWTRRDAVVRLALLMPGLLVAGIVLLVGPELWVALIAFGVLLCTAVLIVVAARRVIAPGRTGPRDDESYFAPYAGGMTPFLLSTLSTFLAVGLSAAAANATAAALPGEDTSTPMLDRVGYAWGLTIVELVALAVAAGVLGLFARRRLLTGVDDDYARPAGETTVLPDGWRGRVATTVTMAQAKRLLPAAVIVFVAIGLLIAGVQVFETFPEALGGSVSTGALGWLSEPRSAEGAAPFIAIGTWLLVAVAGYVVAVSRDAIRNTSLRRGINVIWDVFSFWPHAVHPFVPRPYSRWTVIELRNRVRHHMAQSAEPGRAVIVAAHSQGSLIAYAALLTLTHEERSRVAFLSCGSQLRVIFPRAFPAYVNLPTHRALFASLDGAWINLYRRTDLLAGPVLSWAHTEDASRHFPLAPGAAGPDDFPLGTDRCRRCGNDWRLIDPVPHDADVETGAVAAIHGHHDFWGDPGWARALAALREAPP